MAEKNILAIHDAFYEYLIGIYNENEEFKFRIRLNDDDSFKNGYWFYGNKEETYLHVSFWRFDNKNNTNTIRLYLPLKTNSGNAYCELEANGEGNENSERIIYFQKMVIALGFKEGAKKNNWFKQVEKNVNPITTLALFLKKEKPIIDKYINDNPKESVVGFISEDKFQADCDRVANYRNKVLTNATQQLRDFILEDARLRSIPLPKLPNILSRIYISNFQGIKELIIENLPFTTKWIFLTGENGFGKTSILRGIAKGLIGDENFVSPMSKDAIILLNAFVNSSPYNRQAEEKSKINVSLAAYGVSRFRLAIGDQASSERSQQKTYSLFHDDGQLFNIEQELINSNAYDQPRFEKLKSLFLKLIPNLQDIKIDATNGSPKVRYYEKDDKNETYEAVSLNDLAAGFRSILTMIGDMVIRLAEGKSNFDNLSGIVLIDEIDAHLHPKYQYELPKLLSDIFPKVQFIVTTHSPIPILGLPKDNEPVILTVERSSEQGITIDRKDDDFDIRKLSPEALLTSPIFGFQTLFARGATADEIIPTSDFNEVLEIEEIKERLKKLRAEGLVQ